MSDEVFPYPTVKSVAFEIRFPHLFSIENRIGEFQEQIMVNFPESRQVLRQQLMFRDSTDDIKLERIRKEINPNSVTKGWVFKSLDKTEVTVHTNSLNIVSGQHKTYDAEGADKKFRDVISYVVNAFLSVIRVQVLSRIGLRYTDYCPVPSNNSEAINRLYNLILPTARFPLENLERMHFELIMKRKNHKLIYQETFITSEEMKQSGVEPLPGPFTLLLDFDGFDTNIPANNYLTVTNELHQIIKDEYLSIIKDPVKEYMRTGKIQ